MKLRIAILGIGLFAFSAGLDAQIRVQSQDFNAYSAQEPISPEKPRVVDSQSPSDLPSVGQQSEFGIAVFPIPAVDVVYVEIANAIQDEYIRVTLFDQDGHRVPAHQERSGYLFQIEIGTLQPGRYRIEVITNTQEESAAIEVL